MSKLRICFTSDMHGFFMPTDYASQADKPMGLAKAATLFRKDDDTLIIDGGDTLQGSPFTGFQSRQKGGAAVSARCMNIAGYDYVTFGNHDFNYGIEYLADYLNTLNAVCVCCNIRDKDGLLDPKPYVIHTMKSGLRVGITGACTHYIKVWEAAETLARLEIEEPVPALKRTLAEMKPLCDVTVCIYHGGFERNLDTGELLTESAENQACLIADEMDFDILLTGHQHIAMSGRMLGGSYAVQNADRVMHHACITADVTEDGISCVSELVPSAGEPMAEMVDAIRKEEADVQRWLDLPVGHLDEPLPTGDHLDLALNGCAIANLVNQVQKEVSGADICATALANVYPGMGTEVTVRDVVSAYIYSNTLVKLEITGAVLKRYMERTAEYFDLRDGQPVISDAFLQPKVEHYNYDYFSGLDYVIDIRRPRGDRVVSMIMDGRPIAPDQVLSVCVNSYRASGTGGYEMLKGLPVLKDIQHDVSELILQYIEKRELTVVDKHRSLKVIW